MVGVGGAPGGFVGAGEVVACSVPEPASCVGVPNRFQNTPTTRSAASIAICSSMTPCGPSRCSRGQASVSQRHSDSRHPRSAASPRLSSSTTACASSRSGVTSPGETSTPRR